MQPIRLLPRAKQRDLGSVAWVEQLAERIRTVPEQILMPQIAA